MLEAITLLEVEIERIMKLAVVLRQTGLRARADYREAEVNRFNKILDLLYVERGYEYMNFDIAQLEIEINRLERLAEKFSQYGMTNKVHNYRTEIINLRACLDLLKWSN